MSLIEEAKEAINAVFSDTSVSQEQTLDAMKELRDEIDLLIESVESDIRLASA